MKAREFIFESAQTTLGGFKVTPLNIEDQDVDEAIGLNAPHRRMSRDELQGYANRIKTGTKTKKDRFNRKLGYSKTRLKRIAEHSRKCTIICVFNN
jgi:hypothetical protein